MPVILHHLARRLRSESGFTLVELLAAVSIGTIVMLAVFELMDVSVRATTRVQDRVDVTQRGRTAMEQVTQSLRSQVCIGNEPPVRAGADDEVRFFVDLGGETPAPALRRLALVNGAIVEETYELTGATPAASPILTRTVIDDVERAGGQPIFRYHAYSRATLQVDTDSPLATPLTDELRARTVHLGVRFRARPSGTPAGAEPDAVFQSGVFLRPSDRPNPADAASFGGPRCS